MASSLMGRLVHIHPFPIGIDPALFLSKLECHSVQERICVLKKKFEGKKVFIGVDRLDYIKGVPNRLYAFDLFLKKYPQFRGKAVLIQIAVPTRTDVQQYKDLQKTVNELAGRNQWKIWHHRFFACASSQPVCKYRRACFALLDR